MPCHLHKEADQVQQLSQKDLEVKLMNRRLAQISPMALLNFLRIFLIRLKDFRWQSGEITKNIPEIHASEWPKIIVQNRNFNSLLILREILR